jgi:hypothetical protein
VRSLSTERFFLPLHGNIILTVVYKFIYHMLLPTMRVIAFLHPIIHFSPHYSFILLLSHNQIPVEGNTDPNKSSHTPHNDTWTGLGQLQIQESGNPGHVPQLSLKLEHVFLAQCLTVSLSHCPRCGRGFTFFGGTLGGPQLITYVLRGFCKTRQTKASTNDSPATLVTPVIF